MLLTCVVPPACHDVHLCNRCQTKFWYEHPGPWCHLPTQARVCLLDQVLMPPGVSPGLPVPLLSALPSAPTECDIVDTSMGQLEVYISVYAASGAGAAHVPFFFWTYLIPLTFLTKVCKGGKRCCKDCSCSSISAGDFRKEFLNAFRIHGWTECTAWAIEEKFAAKNENHQNIKHILYKQTNILKYFFIM